MSGLREMGGPFNPGDGKAVSQAEVDTVLQYEVQYPSADGAFIGTASQPLGGTTFTITNKNVLPDYPRNLKYSMTTVNGAGTAGGGTFSAQFYNQFGSLVNETGGFGTAPGGGTFIGTQICAKFVSASFIGTGLSGTLVGTCTIGFGTATGGLGTGFFFGLPAKLGGTADVKNIAWGNNGTMTGLAGGTAIGTLVNTLIHAFQGTSGIAITDYYSVTYKPTFDNNFKGNMFTI